jgi:uncharacterized protein (UPF0276 family)
MGLETNGALPAISVLKAGLGLRRDFIEDVLRQDNIPVDFFEVAPENWVHLGGRYGRLLRQISERYPLICHGLSLDLGGLRPLDIQMLKDFKRFFAQHHVRYYSEHLSYCCDEQGHLYDLMPIPFTEDAVYYVADRIRQVQDILEMRIAIENISFYAMPSSELTEVEFVNAVLEEADCRLLLDVNNTYVNAINHQVYDAYDYIAAMPTDRIAYLHMAGHYDEADDLKIDTHGQPVKGAVWDLYAYTLKVHGVQPTLLERDFNIPPLNVLLEEVVQIRTIQESADGTV